MKTFKITEDIVNKILAVILNSNTNMINADVYNGINELRNLPEDDSAALLERIRKLEKEEKDEPVF